MNSKRLQILVLGGRGFLGEAVCHELRNHAVFTFGNSAEETNHFQGNILSLTDLKRAMTGKDYVINLVGLSPLRKPHSTSYEEIHVQGVKNVLLAWEDAKFKRLIHISALGADKESHIAYLRTKGESEELILNSGISTTVFCPSFIFDRDNELIKYARRFAYSLMFPNIPAKIQPIFRGDMAKLIKLAVEEAIMERRIEVAGPEVMTVFALAKRVFRKKGMPCIPIPLFFLKPGMKLAAFFSMFGLSNDQISMLYTNSITDSNSAAKYTGLTRFDDWLKVASF